MQDPPTDTSGRHNITPVQGSARQLDGSPAVRIGDGRSFGLSPDGLSWLSLCSVWPQRCGASRDARAYDARDARVYGDLRLTRGRSI